MFSHLNLLVEGFFWVFDELTKIKGIEHILIYLGRHQLPRAPVPAGIADTFINLTHFLVMSS